MPTVEYPYLNFYHLHHFTWDGDDYPTIAHAFYAARCADRSQRRWIRACPSPVALNWMLKQVPARSDWESVKEGILNDVVKAKFASIETRNALLVTVDAEIVDGYLPDNLLGKAMMKVRAELKQP